MVAAVPLSSLLTLEERQALLRAQHPNPHGILGLHRHEAGGLRALALMPGAVDVQCIDLAQGKAVAQLQALEASGLFVAHIRRKEPFDYFWRVRWTNGVVTDLFDASAFGNDIGEQDLYYLGQGTHTRPYEVLGAHLQTRRLGEQEVHGVRFTVWAPNAGRVSVVGSFNAWDGRRHPLRRVSDAGLWSLFVPHVAKGDFYKFELTDRHGHLLPLKADPFAFATELRPASASVVHGLPPKRLADADALRWRNDPRAPISIYEVHLPSWARAQDGSMLGWAELGARLSRYASEMGFTHIELLPVTEHPFDGSWGYQCLGMFAPTARHGDVNGFAEFVAACHERGLGVLLDWVPAHFPKDAHGLARFDGTALYEYEDPREGEHKDWGTLIYNYARYEVADFLAGSALFWPERYGVDGLRVDAVASMLYRDYSRKHGEWVPNAFGGRENLEAIALFRRMNEALEAHAPGSIRVAEESTAFPGVTRAAQAGGLGFSYKWNMGWMNDTLSYMREDPVHRKYHHSKMTFGMVYAYSEKFVLPLSHDEVVHGKGSILGRMPGDEWQKFANLRAYYAFMWAHPGKKLLFMGQEFAQDSEWNHNISLPWYLSGRPMHAGVSTLIRDLNRVYRELTAMHQLDCDPRGFEWIDANNADESVFSWVRRDESGQCVLVVCNMTPVPRFGFRVGVPDGPSAWVERINTDAQVYGGSGMGNFGVPVPTERTAAHGRAQSIVITVPPLATLYLVAA